MGTTTLVHELMKDEHADTASSLYNTLTKPRSTEEAAQLVADNKPALHQLLGISAPDVMPASEQAIAAQTGGAVTTYAQPDTSTSPTSSVPITSDTLKQMNTIYQAQKKTEASATSSKSAPVEDDDTLINFLTHPLVQGAHDAMGAIGGYLKEVSNAMHDAVGNMSRDKDSSAEDPTKYK